MLKRIIMGLGKTPKKSLLKINNAFLEKHVESIEDILKVACPPVLLVNNINIATSDINTEHFDVPEGNSFFMDDFRPDILPPCCEPLGGFYNYDDGIVYIPQTMCFSGTDIHYDFRPADTLLALCHELKHVHQDKYDHDRYYSHNSSNYVDITDEAEIDADAFALAYYSSKNCMYTPKDSEIMFSQICVYDALCLGKRFERAFKLAEEYGLDSKDSLKEIQKSVSPLVFDQNGHIVFNVMEKDNDKSCK